MDNGDFIYELLDVLFIGYNVLLDFYDFEWFLGRNEDGINNFNLFEYGGGVLEVLVENVIYIING